MEISVLKLPISASRWNLVLEYMKLRKHVFMEQKRWDLIARDGIEFEQYDTVGYADYVLAHDGDEVLAGCRLVQCSKQVGQYSYMIKDAFEDVIDLPSEICSEPPPVTDDVWELTRLVSRTGDRSAALMVMKGAYDFLSAVEATKCLCLSSPAVQRLARISGFESRPIGPVCGDKSGKFLAFEIDVCPLSSVAERAGLSGG